jgi:hypothetical protein
MELQGYAHVLKVSRENNAIKSVMKALTVRTAVRLVIAKTEPPVTKCQDNVTAHLDILHRRVKVAVKLGNMETAAVQIANAVNQIQ